VSPSNLVLEPGSSGAEDLVASIDRGLWVHSVAGTGFGLDPSSGQLSLKARGLWVENGQPAYAVDGILIVGQLPRILQSVVAVASDARWQPGYGSQAWTLTPSALVSELAVVGNG
jgi:PmbA protein